MRSTSAFPHRASFSAPTTSRDVVSSDTTTPIFTALVAAIEQHDETQLMSLLAQTSMRQKLNIHLPDGDTLLHKAVEFGNANIVKALLDADADPWIADIRKKDNSGGGYCNTPLHSAVKISGKNGNANIVDLLVQKSLKKEKGLGNQHNGDKETPLFIAADNGNVEALKSLLKDPNIKPDITCDRQVVEKETDHEGITKDVRKTFQWSPLHVAVEDRISVEPGHLDCAMELLKKGARHERKKTALHLSAQHGNVELLRSSINIEKAKGTLEESLRVKEVSQGVTPFLYAVNSGELDCVQLLLNEGADFTDVDNNEKNALHVAAAGGNIVNFSHLLIFAKERLDQESFNNFINARNLFNESPLATAQSHNQSGIVKQLIREGVDPRHLYGEQESIFNHAANEGQLEIIQSVLEMIEDNGINKKIAEHIKEAFLTVDREGYTPFLDAVSGCDEKMLTLMLKNGASLTDRAPKGANVFHFVAKNTNIHVAQQLVNEVEKQSVSEGNSTSLTRAMLNEKYANEATPLFSAAIHDSHDNVRLFIQCGADPKIIQSADDRDHSVIDLAADRGRDKTMQTALTMLGDGSIAPETATSLKEALFSVNSDGCSPFLLACQTCNSDTLKLMVKHGCSIEDTRPGGGNVLCFSAINTNDGTFQVILNAIDELGKKAEDPAAFKHEFFNKRMENGLVPLAYHVDHDRLENVIQLLSMGAVPQSIYKKIGSETEPLFIENLFHRIVFNKQDEMMQSLLEIIKKDSFSSEQTKNLRDAFQEKNHQGDSPLLMAAELCEPEILKVMVKHGASLDALNNNGETALHTAAKGNRGDNLKTLIVLAKGQGLDQQLLSHTNRNFLTPFLSAASLGCADSIRCLIAEFNVDLFQSNNVGQNALHLAAVDGHSDAIKVLLPHAKKTQCLKELLLATDEKGFTAFDLAVKQR